MKKIRKNAFETNSSSYHSLIVHKSVGLDKNILKFNEDSSILTVDMTVLKDATMFVTEEEKIFYTIWSSFNNIGWEGMEKFDEIPKEEEANWLNENTTLPLVIDWLKDKFSVKDVVIKMPEENGGKLDWLFEAVDDNETDPLNSAYGRNHWGGIEFLSNKNDFIYRVDPNND